MMDEGNKSIQYLIKRISDLSSRASEGYYVTSTEFLDLNQLSQSISFLNSQHVPYIRIGGYNNAERAMLLLLPFINYDINTILMDDFVKYIHIKLPKVGQTKSLTHRDYLGALMNLGIERKVIGDILVGSNEAVIICQPSIAAFIMTSLLHIGRTKVSLDIIDNFDSLMKEFEQNYDRIKGTVASLRLDNVIKLGTKLSRTNALQYIKAGKVFVNGREIIQASYMIVENDIISIRGIGKIKLVVIGQMSKKDRQYIEIDQYN